MKMVTSEPVEEGSGDGTRPEDGVPDMTYISDIDEEGINVNLKTRYNRNQIYTYTGTILVAVNPYKKLDIYDPEYVYRYNGKKIRLLEPHVFAIAEAAFSNLQEDGQNQACVISGESGAGKTENTKFILQYLCSVTSNVSTWIEQQILEANTILEAFGNAKTVRNDNSSRFGKFIQVCFDEKSAIKGCIIQDYLLEQSRITFQSSNERNYHVFYQLVCVAERNEEIRNKFMIESADKYNYLSQSGCVSIESVDDYAKFDSLRLAMSVLNISTETCDGIFCVLSAILWIGNLEFQDVDGESSSLSQNDNQVMATISKLLSVNVEDLSPVALKRQINVRGTVTDIPLKLHEAKENRHSMAKVLYSRTFAWIINHINSCTNPGKGINNFLGVLDIFGFENFAVNSFEQLCINYTNEKLHKFFNHYVFALEQDLYEEEGIVFEHITFTDNTQCLELMEKSPKCILRLLSEECKMPKGSDVTYVNKLHQEFAEHANYWKGDDRRRWDKEFGVKHYAGTVTYAIAGFIDKNKDAQQDLFFEILQNSSNSFIKDLTKYQDLLGAKSSPSNSDCGTISRATGKGRSTVSDAFRQQLSALVDVLQNTNPWYVRCIKPNTEKLSDKYVDNQVVTQLRYLGMLDIIRIRREGYPIHITMVEFLQKFRCLVAKECIENDRPAADNIQTLIQSFQLNEKDWQIGKTRVFMRSTIFEPLESKRKVLFLTKSIFVQKIWRGYVKRQAYLRKKSSIMIIQHHYRGMRQRLQFLRTKRAAIIIQSFVRVIFAKEVVNALRDIKRKEDERKRQEIIEEEKRKAEELARQEMEEKERNELEEKIRLQLMLESEEEVAQEELATLAALAELNVKRAQETSECLDLDEMFSFLTELQDGKQPATDLVEKIGSSMDMLIQDIDQARVSGGSSVEPDASGEEVSVEKSNIVEEVPRSMVDSVDKLPPPPPPNTLPPPPPAPSFVNSSALPVAPAMSPMPKSRPPSSELPPPPPQQLLNGVQQRPPPEVRDVRLIRKSEPKKRQTTGVNEVSDPERELRRKQRVEKKLTELGEVEMEENELLHYDLIEFAEKYFNAHPKDIGSGTMMKSLARRRKSSAEVIPKYEMVTFTKATTIPNSHIQMYDPENVNAACTVFKDMCKYMKGDLKVEVEILTIQGIVSEGIERDEVKDEIFVHLMRQTNNNPSRDANIRLWTLLCLCVIAFHPTKLLQKYLLSYLKNNVRNNKSQATQHAQWCLDNLRNPKVRGRKMPPSVLEIKAVRNLEPLLCRFFFLDDRTKAIDVHPSDTAMEAMQRLAEKINLKSLDGWALYEVTPEYEHVIRSYDYLGDIISQWESFHRSSANFTKYSTLSKNGPTEALGGGECRFVFRKRLFKNAKEIPQDPIEVNLLYAQAVYSVVKKDEFPVNDRIAFQLAGLQAQVSLGEPQFDKLDWYTDVENYLSERVCRGRKQSELIRAIADAHMAYGSGKNELVAKVLYLSCVMQYPIYGCSMFPVKHRGYWSYGSNLLLGINADGIMMINPNDKAVINAYRYCDIETVVVDASDDFVTVNLLKTLPDSHKCFVFETDQKHEIGSLVASYSPSHANCMDLAHKQNRRMRVSNEDRQKLHHDVINCRRTLANSGLLRRPVEENVSIFMSTLRKFNKNKFRQETNDSTDDYHKTYKHTYWSFGRNPLSQTLSVIPDPEIDDMAVQQFTTILSYAGLSVSGEIDREFDHVAVIQSVIEKSIRREMLLNELFVQLMKQTTDHPDPNSRVNLRHWQLLTVLCTIKLPADKRILNYVVAHLRRCAADYVTEEGKYAQFALKCLSRTAETKGRKWPPSRDEVTCTMNRRWIHSRIFFMDGQFQSIEFDASACAIEVVESVKRKLELDHSAKGYGLYEVLGGTERCLLPDEKLADAMSKWEKYNPNRGRGQRKHHCFVFKKHLFVDSYVNLSDPIERELLHHQIIHNIRTDRYPITEQEAIMLCALKAQVDIGDCTSEKLIDYRALMASCLPPRMLMLVPIENVVQRHQCMNGMSVDESKTAFLSLIQSWPLHRSTIFEVTQTYTSTWPKILWLAIEQSGVHLLEHHSKNVLCTCEYDKIVSYSPSINSLMIVTGNVATGCKYIFSTNQASQIAHLIKDYSCVMQERYNHQREMIRRRISTTSSGDRQMRPVSILHRPPPKLYTDEQFI